MPSGPCNTLYYGDNLDILRRYIADESVDLIYLDPPFNSNADYNVLFAEQDGAQAASPDQGLRRHLALGLRPPPQAYRDVLQSGIGRVASASMAGFKSILGCSDMLAYLSMMAPRLVELRRVLKPTGSIYLHCDPTACHYLKLAPRCRLRPGEFPERDHLEAHF